MKQATFGVFQQAQLSWNILQVPCPKMPYFEHQDDPEVIQWREEYTAALMFLEEFFNGSEEKAGPSDRTKLEYPELQGLIGLNLLQAVKWLEAERIINRKQGGLLGFIQAVEHVMELSYRFDRVNVRLDSDGKINEVISVG